MESVIVKSLGWKLMERFGVSGMQFIFQIVMARMLSPEHYGALSIMIVFTNLANVFIQQGFNTALIQRKDVTEEDYSSVLWVSVGIAMVLYLVIFLSAPAIGVFYAMPDIVVPMRVIALMLFPGALNSVQFAKASKNMDFKHIFIGYIGGTVISGVCGLLVAYFGGGLWALVVQTLLNICVVCLIMKIQVKLTFYFRIDWTRVGTLFSFGWKLLVSSLIETVYQEIRSLVIGKKYNSEMLGYYNRGKQFPQYVISAISNAIQTVMLPAMSAEQDNKTRVKTIARNSIMIGSYAVFPIMAGMIAVANPLVTVLLTEKWIPAVPYLQIYCVTFAFQPIHSSNLQAINAMGRSDIFLKLELIKKAIGVFALIVAVLCFDSPIAIALTGVFTTIISCFVNAYPNMRLVNYSYWEQVKDILPPMVLSVIMMGVVMFVGNADIPAWVCLCLQFITGVVVYALLLFLTKPKPYRAAVGLLHERLIVRRNEKV